MSGGWGANCLPLKQHYQAVFAGAVLFRNVAFILEKTAIETQPEKAPEEASSKVGASELE